MYGTTNRTTTMYLLILGEIEPEPILRRLLSGCGSPSSPLCPIFYASPTTSCSSEPPFQSLLLEYYLPTIEIASAFLPFPFPLLAHPLLRQFLGGRRCPSASGVQSLYLLARSVYPLITSPTTSTSFCCGSICVCIWEI